MSTWLRSLPVRVGTALSKAGASGKQGGPRVLPDGATRSAVVGAIQQQVEASIEPASNLPRTFLEACSDPCGRCGMFTGGGPADLNGEAA